MKFLSRQHCFSFILFVSILFFSEKIFSQDINSQFSFHHYTEEDGLSNQQIICLLQDRSGFLWVGTQDGLFRYDGYEFKVFRYSPTDSETVSQNFITALAEDASGNIWIGTNSNGVCSYNPAKEKFIRFHITGKIQGDHPGRINSLACSNDGKVYFSCDMFIGIYQLNKGRNKFVPFYLYDFDKTLKQSDRANHVFSIYLSGNDTLFAGTGAGLFSIDLKNRVLKSWILPSFFVEQIGQPAIQKLKKNPFANELWIATWGNGILKLNLKTGSAEKYWYSPVPFIQNGNHNIIFDIEFLSANEIFIAGADKEFSILNVNQNSFSFFKHDRANPNSVPDGYCYSIIKDYNGIFWLGFNNGLVKYNPDANRFNNIFFPENIYRVSASDLTEVNGNKIFVNTIFGIGNYVYDLDGNYIESVRLSPNAGGEYESISSVNDAEGSTWFVNYRNMYKYNWKQKKLTPVIEELNSPEPYGFRYLFPTIDGQIIFQFSRRTIAVIQPSENKILFKKRLAYPYADSNQVYLIDIAAAPNKHYWAIFHYGIVEYDSDFKMLNSYSLKINDSTFLGQGFMMDLSIDDEGKVYCVSSDGGLTIIDPEKKSIVNYASGFAMAPTRCSAVTIDHSGIVWIASEQGLSRFNQATQTFTNYDKFDGLPHSQIQYVKVQPSGRVYYFFESGWGWLNPEKFMVGKSNSAVVFTSFKVNEKKYSNGNIDLLTEIELNYNENNLSFEFSLLDNCNPKKNTYAYMMESINENWVMSGTRHQVTYSLLAPGNYVFKVKAANNDGIWSNKIRTIKIFIAPPFWQTWWFRILVLLLIVIVVYSFFKLRMRLALREENLKSNYQKKISELETKALRAQMNPHFIFNCLNSINSFILRNDTEVASEYLTKFSRLIRLVLDNSRTSQITLSSELECLKLFVEMEEMRFANKFEYAIHVDEKINTETIKVPPLIFQPYVENSIWHGLLHKNEKGKLKVEISEQNGYIICVIEDNGIGREAARDVKSKSSGHRKSHGMGITSQRVIEWNQENEQAVNISDLFDEEKKPAGTRVEIKLKIIAGEK